MVEQQKKNISIRCFPGATTQNMHDYIKPTLKRKPDKVVIHVGTNDTKHREAPQIVESIDQLYEKIKTNSRDTDITLSELIIREDSATMKIKVLEVNRTRK